MDPRTELSLVTAKVKVLACVFPAITRQIRALFPTATAGITEWALTQERMPSDQNIFFLFVYYYVRAYYFMLSHNYSLDYSEVCIIIPIPMRRIFL